MNKARNTNVLELAQKIFEVRRILGLDQPSMGTLFGVSAKTIMRWEKGVVLPHPSYIKIIELFFLYRFRIKKYNSDLHKQRTKIKNILILEGVPKTLYVLFGICYGEEK